MFENFSYSLFFFHSVLHESNDDWGDADCISDDDWEFIVVLDDVVADVQ